MVFLSYSVHRTSSCLSAKDVPKQKKPRADESTRGREGHRSQEGQGVPVNTVPFKNIIFRLVHPDLVFYVFTFLRFLPKHT